MSADGASTVPLAGDSRLARAVRERHQGAMYVVDELRPGLPRASRFAAHPDYPQAERAAAQLVARYAADGYRLVERLRDGDRWSRWVLHHDRDRLWAAVELRDEDAGAPPP
jgi:hypothetical protein